MICLKIDSKGSILPVYVGAHLRSACDKSFPASHKRTWHHERFGRVAGDTEARALLSGISNSPVVRLRPACLANVYPAGLTSCMSKPARSESIIRFDMLSKSLLSLVLGAPCCGSADTTGTSTHTSTDLTPPDLLRTATHFHPETVRTANAYVDGRFCV